MDGPLWASNVAMARVLAATILSGCSNIARLRDELGSILTEPSRPPKLPMGWCTQVVQFNTIVRPWPSNYVYVGHGPYSSEVNPSPWGSPFSTSSSLDCPHDDRFIAYAQDRADIHHWLSSLVGKTLVCHCKNGHASIIASLVDKLFSPPCVSESTPQSQPASGLYESGAPMLDDSNFCGNGTFGTSPVTAPQWPDEWVALVENIRTSIYGLAWEIFAGASAITQSLSHRGWVCAPPVDIAHSVHFDVLNPLFTSILVGVILEGRITIMVLDPPVDGSPSSLSTLKVAETLAGAMFRTGATLF